MSDISDDAKRNRVGWTKANAEYTDQSARDSWAAEEMTWGVFVAPQGAPVNAVSRNGPGGGTSGVA